MTKFVKLFQGDCLEVLKQMPDKSVDLVVTDPPYGIQYSSNWSKNKEYRKKVADTTGWDKEFDFSKYFGGIWRVMKNDSDLYVFGRWENYEVMKELGFKRVLIWDKMDNCMGDLKDWGMSYELIFLFKKGKRPINKRVQSVIKCFNIRNKVKEMKHPTQKPEGIIKPLILASSNPDDVVLDCFAGSGTTLKVARDLGRSAIGVELNEDYCNVIKERLGFDVKRFESDYEYEFKEAK